MKWIHLVLSVDSREYYVIQYGNKTKLNTSITIIIAQLLLFNNACMSVALTILLLHTILTTIQTQHRPNQHYITNMSTLQNRRTHNISLQLLWHSYNINTNRLVDGPCWSGSAAGAVGGTAGPVTLRKLVGRGHWDARWLPVGVKEEDHTIVFRRNAYCVVVIMQWNNAIGVYPHS